MAASIDSYITENMHTFNGFQYVFQQLCDIR